MMMDCSRPISRASVIAHTGLPPMPSNQDSTENGGTPPPTPPAFPPTGFFFFFLYTSNAAVLFHSFHFLISFLFSSPFSVDFFKFSAAVAANPLAEHLRLGMRLMRLDQIIFSRKTERKKEKKNKKKMIRHTTRQPAVPPVGSLSSLLILIIF
jgi:hypothetical protein